MFFAKFDHLNIEIPAIKFNLVRHETKNFIQYSGTNLNANDSSLQLFFSILLDNAVENCHII